MDELVERPLGLQLSIAAGVDDSDGEDGDYENSDSQDIDSTDDESQGDFAADFNRIRNASPLDQTADRLSLITANSPIDSIYGISDHEYDQQPGRQYNSISAFSDTHKQGVNEQEHDQEWVHDQEWDHDRQPNLQDISLSIDSLEQDVEPQENVWGLELEPQRTSGSTPINIKGQHIIQLHHETQIGHRRRSTSASTGSHDTSASASSDAIAQHVDLRKDKREPHLNRLLKYTTGSIVPRKTLDDAGLPLSRKIETNLPPLQRFPPRQVDAIYLLYAYINETFGDEGGIFNRGPPHQGYGDDHVQGFRDFLSSPEYQDHPHKDEWLEVLAEPMKSQAHRILHINCQVYRTCEAGKMKRRVGKVNVEKVYYVLGRARSSKYWSVTADGQLPTISSARRNSSSGVSVQARSSNTHSTITNNYYAHNITIQR